MDAHETRLKRLSFRAWRRAARMRSTALAPRPGTRNIASTKIEPVAVPMNIGRNTVTIGSTANNVVCTFTNTARPRVTISKVSLGGVGTFAIQLAKHLGATVATTASAGNAALVQSLGADVVIDYRQQDFEEVEHGHLLRGAFRGSNGENGRDLCLSCGGASCKMGIDRGTEGARQRKLVLANRQQLRARH